ncbi:MAG TPA: lamin tail domain-containing protein, partial [Kofleriaceae bacterium]|nr:lamin tail domain-containing protein [Kofleriaceae bacterium]
MIRAVLLLPALCACSFDPAGGAASSNDAAAAPDAAGDASGPSGDGGAPRPTHLLLTEVKTNPLATEFIEIYNASCTPVDLSDYYLTDSPVYPLLPSWGDTPPVLPHQDAVLRFPDGAVLGAQQVAVIARSETGFVGAYTSAPDYAVTGATLAGAMTLVARGDTADVELRNVGEMVALFSWDGASDLVQDVDLVIAGDAPIAGDGIAGKQSMAPSGV